MSETVLLLPGLLCTRELFAEQLPALGTVAEPVVVELTRDETVAAMAERVLAQAPPSFALAGLSMGGYVALEIMRRAPQRVSRLALLDTQARPDTPEATERRLELMATAELDDFAKVADALIPRFLHPEHIPALAPVVRRMAAATGKDAFARQQRAIMARIDSRADLGRISCPTLVLCGREDALTPPALHEEMAAAIPDATLVVLPRCGHLAPLERPAAVTLQLVAWLDS
jgi:pimeloyl-ACP methyl ester carboxylesterase